MLQDTNRGQWYQHLKIENGSVFAYVFNNYWRTNYKAWQAGPLTFRFALTSGRDITDMQAKQFGEAVQSPLICRPIAGDAKVQLIPRGIGLRRACLCNLAEDKQRELRVRDGMIAVTCPALGLITILLER